MALLQGAIHFEELVPGADRVQRVLAVYKRALAADSPALPDADREELSERSAAFADLYGDAATAEQAAASHAALLRTLAPKGAAADKKRGAEGSAASGAPPSLPSPSTRISAPGKLGLITLACVAFSRCISKQGGRASCYPLWLPAAA